MARVSDYQIRNLRQIEDMAIKHGFSKSQQARFRVKLDGPGVQPSPRAGR